MENCISHSVWPLRVYCHAFRAHQCPAVFQHMANNIFRYFLDIFLIIYLDDLLVYSKIDDLLVYSRTHAENDIHVRKVLQCLREYGLYAKLEKYSFDCKEVEFFGYTISSKGIFMDPAKVQTILEWQTPSSVRDVQRFLRFANFYRKFIWKYSRIVLPLTQLTKKYQAFVWTIGANKAFT